jgi:hypothetical protein
VSCAFAETVPAAATTPSDKARRTADDNLFTSSLITLSNVRVVYNRSGTDSGQVPSWNGQNGTPKAMAVIDTNNICLTWESLAQALGKRLKTRRDWVYDRKKPANKCRAELQRVACRKPGVRASGRGVAGICRLQILMILHVGNARLIGVNLVRGGISQCRQIAG